MAPLDRRRTVFLRTPVARATAHRYIDAAPDNFMVRFSPEVKRRIQEEKYHAMIADIARQSDYAGKLWCTDDMKRLGRRVRRRDAQRRHTAAS